MRRALSLFAASALFLAAVPSGFAATTASVTVRTRDASGRVQVQRMTKTGSVQACKAGTAGAKARCLRLAVRVRSAGGTARISGGGASASVRIRSSTR